MQVPNCRRNPLPPRTAVAFAPGAITNFFSISYQSSGRGGVIQAGATGGGYVLSRGVVSTATVKESHGENEILTVVNGDPSYNARTTRRTLEFMAERYNLRLGHLELRQSVDLPIGSGFGASAASAVSAVYAAATALGLQSSKRDLARCAYDAEIKEQTGLGTVSVIYDTTGAGAIVKPGVPGVARFLRVRVPRGARIVTASLAPYEKRDALSSTEIGRRIVRLGDSALGRFLSDPTFGELAAAGEWFSEELGLESQDVRRLAQLARGAGAPWASQNMIGQAIHAIADETSAGRIVEALRRFLPKPRVDVFEIASAKAGLL